MCLDLTRNPERGTRNLGRHQHLLFLLLCRKTVLSSPADQPMEKPIAIDGDIRKASTLPAAFYRDPALFDRTRETIFARSWQLAGDADSLKAPGQIVPVTLLEGFLDEPVLLTRDH